MNVYGKSKVEAERYVSENCQNYAILRSSIVYGPQTISPVPKALPIQVCTHLSTNTELLNANLPLDAGPKPDNYFCCLPMELHRKLQDILLSLQFHILWTGK